MSHATADLEYFKCDVCGIYLHKDIFCDHRRDCVGLDAKQLKKSECLQLQQELSLGTRQLLAQDEARSSTAAPTSSVRLSTDQLEKRQDARVRRQVANQYQAAQDKLFASKLTEEREKDLLDFLNA